MNWLDLVKKHILPLLQRLLKKKPPLPPPIHSPVQGAETLTVTGAYPKYTSLKPHKGIDFACKKGDPLIAICDGIVSRVRQGRRGSSPASYVVIDTPTESVIYRHCGKSPLSFGDDVKAGDLVGFADLTGRTTGYHLHFEVQDKKGNHVEPLTVLKRYQPNIKYRLLRGRWNGFTLHDIFSKYNPDGLVIIKESQRDDKKT